MRRAYLVIVIVSAFISAATINAVMFDTKIHELRETLKLEYKRINLIEPDRILIGRAIAIAEELISSINKSAIPEEMRGTYLESTELLSKAKTGTSWDSLINARKSAVDARMILAYGEVKRGELTKDRILKERAILDKKLKEIESSTSYHCSDLSGCIPYSEVEESIYSAIKWLDQIDQLEPIFKTSKERALIYAAGSIEAAEGNLDDAEYLLKQISRTEKRLDGSRYIDSVYRKLSKNVELEIQKCSDINGTFAEQTCKEAVGYYERGVEKFKLGLKASSIVDVIAAKALLGCVDDMLKIPDPWNSSAVDSKSIYGAKLSAVSSVNRASSKIAAMVAEEDIKAGDKLVKRIIETGRSGEAANLAYALYLRAAGVANLKI
ncbi:hypothetical protein [Archaeoglobus neptunius]|uniref:hypothetical protein n=1 Tax=Archaeoglobus neptunius TaxID=2798580 RepID=UPI00192810D2|nr:hypothetical protein [Archaeoglobus neptunius]